MPSSVNRFSRGENVKLYSLSATTTNISLVFDLQTYVHVEFFIKQKSTKNHLCIRLKEQNQYFHIQMFTTGDRFDIYQKLNQLKKILVVLTTLKTHGVTREN